MSLVVDPVIFNGLKELLMSMADDELILGHRDSEWCGHAPILEEDIAFANLALDELGHANLWYTLLAELSSEDPLSFPDRMVFLRDAADFRNMQMVELPNGDWAYSMLRQFLFDAAESVRLEALAHSAYQPLALLAAKIRKEEAYHLRHTRAWVRRLGLGTEESHRRLQSSLDTLFPLTGQLFIKVQEEDSLATEGILDTGDVLRQTWESQVVPFLVECGLALPEVSNNWIPPRDQHTVHLKVLVNEMQSLVRAFPEMSW